jgi:lysophospholipase L1-like esterase
MVDDGTYSAREARLRLPGSLALMAFLQGCGSGEKESGSIVPGADPAQTLPTPSPTPPATPSPAALPDFGPFNGEIVGYGDSRTQSQYKDYPINRVLSSRNFLTVGRALSGNRIKAGPDFGVSGDTTAKALARLNEVTAAAPRYVVIRLGVNSIAIGVSAAETFRDIQQMSEALIKVGSEPILVLETGSGNLPASLGAAVNDLNARLQAYADSRGLRVFDPRPALLSSTPGIWPFVFREGYSEDDLHANLRGAIAEGTAFWNFMSPFVSSAPSLAATGASLLANASLSDPDGGELVDGASGTVPAAFTARTRGSPGATAIFSVNKLSDGSNEIVMVATATGAATYADPQGIGLEQVMDAAGLKIGDVICGGVEISIDAGATGLIGVTTFVRYTGENGLVIEYDMYPDVGEAFGTIDGGITYATRTKPLQVQKTPSEASWYSRAYFASAGTATIRFRRPWAGFLDQS